MNKQSFAVLSLLWTCGTAVAQQAVVVDGNVHFRPSSGAALQRLTTRGLDTEATLSPDGKLIAFVRRTPNDLVHHGVGDAEATELWTIRVDGTHPRRILRGRNAPDMAQVLAGFSAPSFSPDGKLVYFVSHAWATSRAVHVADLERDSERFVCPGSLLEVVPRGQYAGHLVVRQHRYFLAGEGKRSRAV